ncbi:type IV secretory system conjugative DNA transfer family protein [Bdellovibrio sp. HCB290]|uniref:type IV secretory system conjugative DNA transfer family protein n=1 Tax=Bdellovibrio sp. HCB290 TaxID=3394356 RepID=UPI0039B5249E
MFIRKLFPAIGQQRKPSSQVRLGRVEGSFFKSEKLTDEELNHHVHIVGASGFGKTVLLTKILKSRIKANHGCLWLDLKGDKETIESMIQTVKEAGREQDLQIFSLTDIATSSNYNLLNEGNATELRDRIMGALEWSEEFYKGQAALYLLRILTVLCHIRKETKESFDLHDLYNACTDEGAVFNLTQKVSKEHPKIKTLAEQCYHYLTAKETSGNLQGLVSQLESFLLASFGERLKKSKEGINLYEAVNQQKIVFIFLDTRRYKFTGTALAKFIVKDLIATSARIDAEIPKAQRKPFVCFIDEFADIADEDFTAFPDRARSSKMSLVLSHQELSDLKKVSDTFAARLTANMATLYAFLQSNQESAETISQRAGTKTTWKTTKRTQRVLFWDVSTGESSMREVEEFNVHPNVVKSLTVGRCVCIKKYPHARAHIVRVDEK